MKRDKFFDIAEKMFVEQFITANEIGNRVGVHERTISRWKTKGNWNEKRKSFYKEITVSKKAIYEFSRKMLREIEKDIDNKKHVDPSRFYIFLNLMERLVKHPRKTDKRQEFVKDFLPHFDFDDFQLEF